LTEIERLPGKADIHMISLLRQIAGLPLIHQARRLARAFLAQTERADEIQRQVLARFVRRNAASRFGRNHRFDLIHDPDEFRRRVPIRDYAAHEPYIAQVRDGDPSALFGPGAEVLMFAMTSGTTAAPKTIPVTRESLHAYRESWKVWGIMAFDAHPEMLRHGLKPILQLVSDWRENHTSAGIPCGAITGLTAQMQHPLIRGTYCMPPASMAVKDIESKYYLALRLGLPKDVGAVMAANPGTLLGIARLGDRERETLLRDLAQGTVDKKWQIPAPVRASVARRVGKKRPALVKRLEQVIAASGGLYPMDYWPNLSFVANWTGGSMGMYLSHFPRWFGQTPVRDIGLIASEGRFTIPIEDHTASGLLDISRHFFEFLPEEDAQRDVPDTVLAHELEIGRRYYVLPTTAGGLYRYQIHDLVKCTGYHGKAPLIEFLNKGSHFSSLAGEKLSEFHVVEAVDGAARTLGISLSSSLLVPRWSDPPEYVLLVEQQELEDRLAAPRLADTVEINLCRINCEYENRRATLRLGRVRVVPVAAGSWAAYQRRRLSQSGGTPEQYKQPRLVPDPAIYDDFELIEPVPRAPESSRAG
jgi:hypothetical protein